MLKSIFRPLTAPGLLALVSLAACAPAGATDLIVSAAISLKESCTDIGSAFEKMHPGDKVIFNFGASGTLAAQIKHGAPVDLFASASQEQVDKLIGLGLIDKTTCKTFARNSLAVIVPLNGPELTSLEQLGDIRRLAIGDPQTVPAGTYAEQALKKATVLEKLKKNHALILGENVRQVLTYVESGDVDAGIVYSTDALSSKKVQISMHISADRSKAIVYPIAVVKESKNKALAKSFIDFILQKQQQIILQNHGFLPAQ